MDTPTPDRALAAHAAARLGLFSRGEARKLGFSDHMIRSRVRAGRWVVVASGMYRIGGMPVTWHQRLLAACLLGGEGAVASHRSAGVLWKMQGMRPGRLQVTVRPGAGANRSARLATVHRSAHLTAGDITTTDHIPVTSASRTVIDLAGELPAERLTEVVDGAVCAGVLKLDALDEAIARLDPARPGLGRLRRLLAAWTPGPMPGSAEEMRVLRVLTGYGIAEPVRQHEVLAGGRLVARMDLAWPDSMVGLELQSLRWHGSPTSYHADRGRVLELQSLGWEVIEVTPRLLRTDGGKLLCRAVSAALARR